MCCLHCDENRCEVLANLFRNAIIDRHYRFEQLPEADATVETGRKRGGVVVSVTPG